MMDHKESLANEKIYQLGQIAKGDIYPVTIIHDAHNELSGAQWLAFQSFPDEIPKIFSLTADIQEFWQDHDDLKLPIGKGNTPDEALEDLKVKAKKYYESW